MLEHLLESMESCLAFKVSDKLTKEDYAAFLPKINERFFEPEKIDEAWQWAQAAD